MMMVYVNDLLHCCYKVKPECLYDQIKFWQVFEIKMRFRELLKAIYLFSVREVLYQMAYQ
jgi:predicted nucleic acid-binding protein